MPIPLSERTPHQLALLTLVSHVQLLRITFPIAFTRLLILQEDQPCIHHHSQHTHARDSHANGVAQMVKMRNVLSLEAESRHDATRVAESNHPRAADAPLRVSVLIHEVPADDDGTGGEAAHGDQTYA